MKLYATTTSERASKGQGGNKYLNIDINVLGDQDPSYRVRVIDDELLDIIYLSFENKINDKWVMLYSEKLIYNKLDKEKGKQKKGETNTCKHNPPHEEWDICSDMVS